MRGVKRACRSPAPSGVSERFVHPQLDTGEKGSTQRRCLDDLRTLDGNAEQVGKKLSKPVVGGHTPVDTQELGWIGRIALPGRISGTVTCCGAVRR